MPADPSPPPRRAMSNDHKAALARGRAEGHAVRRYLEAVDVHRPRPGRRRGREAVERRLCAVRDRIETAPPLRRLHLLQEKADLEAELARLSGAELAVLENAFVEVARAYGDRKGIGYGAWRAAGVSAAVLERAGITKTDTAPSGAARGADGSR